MVSLYDTPVTVLTYSDSFLLLGAVVATRAAAAAVVVIVVVVVVAVNCCCFCCCRHADIFLTSNLFGQRLHPLLVKMLNITHKCKLK